MTRPRVAETDQGIQGEFTVNIYDQMQRRLTDKGWIETKDILKSGITKGIALENGLIGEFENPMAGEGLKL
jgi:hypothetical protein